MKTFFLFLLLLPLAAGAQFYFGLGAANNYSLVIKTGYVIEKHIDLQMGVYPAYLYTDKNATISYYGAGYTIKNFTATVAAANHSYTDQRQVPGASGWHTLYSIDYSASLKKGKLFNTVAITNGKVYLSFGIKTYIP